MPELPEVETLKCYLEKQILTQRIESLIATRDSIRYKLDSKLDSKVRGTTINSITRAAKYISINLDNDKSIIVHLGMSGRFTVKPLDYMQAKHDHIIINLTDYKLVFNDPRRFGMLYCCNSRTLNEEKFLKNLGPEPLSDDFNSEYLLKVLKNRKSAIKTILMNNRMVVGVGNIYASESLYLAQINPLRPANSLNQKELELLAASIKQVLAKAIKAGGTTLRDFVNGDSNPGYFKQQLNVYDMEGKLCFICDTKITKIKQAGRTTYFCPNCQKEKI